MKKITTIHNVNYYLCSYPGQDMHDFPWGQDTFDCIIFPPANESQELMDDLLNHLPYDSLDWIATAEPASEHWHDRIDRESVKAGVQKEIGEGKPMTAWFDDLTSIEDLDTSHNLGGSEYCLIIVVGEEPIPKRSIIAIEHNLIGE